MQMTAFCFLTFYNWIIDVIVMLNIPANHMHKVIFRSEIEHLRHSNLFKQFNHTRSLTREKKGLNLKKNEKKIDKFFL